MNIATKPNHVCHKSRANLSSDIAILGKANIKVFEAKTFFSRLRGLHEYLPLQMNEGLIIRPCNAVHTMTMSDSIDVVFFDNAGVVLRAETVAPFRFVRCKGAASVLEMSEGSLERLNIVIGDLFVRESGTWV